MLIKTGSDCPETAKEEDGSRSKGQFGFTRFVTMDEAVAIVFEGRGRRRVGDLKEQAWQADVEQ